MNCRSLKATQRAWAARLRLDVDDRGYVRNLRDNLLRPLSSDTERDIRQGSGGELDDSQDARPAKMRALFIHHRT